MIASGTFQKKAGHLEEIYGGGRRATPVNETYFPEFLIRF